MQPIRIIDANFNVYAELDDYESLIWTRRWHKPGEFELHISVAKANTEQLEKGRILVAGEKAAFILHREISVEENGEALILIKGPTIASMVGRRITVPPEGMAYDRISARAEEVMKLYVDRNCVSPVDLRRKIPSLVNAPNRSRGPDTVYLSRLKALDAELEAVSLSSGLGWDVSLDIANKQWIFETYEGRNLTAGQTDNPPVIFSVDFDAVKAQIFIDSDIGYRNTGYVGGQGEGEEREIIEVGSSLSGLERLETFIDARDIEDGTDLASRGQQKLTEMSEIQTFDNKILTNGPYRYREDWDLGDIVTAMNRQWDVTLDARITEVKEIYEPDGFKLEATFGNHVPTLIEKLKKTLDSPLVEKSSKNNSTLASANSYTDTKVAALVDSSPAVLDTLNELAAALGDDPNFATTMTDLIGSKETPADAQAKVDAHANLTTNPHTVTKSQVGLGSVANYGIATQADAQAGTVNTEYMTPLRTKEAIIALQSIASVAGRTGDVVLTKADVGLSNVDNVQQAPAARTISAGNGLTGGGDLTANRTLTLGTPGTLTPTTTNSTTSTSHTHNVDTATQAEAEAGTSGAKFMTPQRTSQALAKFVTDNSLAKKAAVNIGDGVATIFDIAHGLANLDISWTVREVATGDMVLVESKIVDVSTLRITFPSAPSLNQYRVTIVG